LTKDHAKKHYQAEQKMKIAQQKMKIQKKNEKLKEEEKVNSGKNEDGGKEDLCNAEGKEDHGQRSKHSPSPVAGSPAASTLNLKMSETVQNFKFKYSSK
jgi:hypothetical protein